MLHLTESRALILLAASTIAVYLPGLFGGFLYDDFWNVVHNPAILAVDGTLETWLHAAVSSSAGPLRRPISMLTFAANHYLFGMSPLAFKAVNLLIHVLNGWLCYLLMRHVLPHLAPWRDSRHSQWLTYASLLVAALWTLHPLHVSSVVYVVQRMSELSATFVLLGLLFYARGRERMITGQGGAAAAMCAVLLFGTMAVLSKENGALIVLFALAIEAFCFRFGAATDRNRRAIRLFLITTVALPIAALALHLALSPEWLLQGYAERSFTLTERLLTQCRVLVTYLWWTVAPWPSNLGLYHDEIVASRSLIDPLTTLAAIAFWLALVATALRLRRKWPALAFALAWYAAGHAMESTFLPLEMVFEHRNYLSILGPLAAFVVLLDQLDATRDKRALSHGLATLTIVALVSMTATRTYAWGDNLRLAISSARHHPESARYQYDAGRETILMGLATGDLQSVKDDARAYFLRAMALDPTFVHPATSYLQTFSGERPLPSDKVEDLAYRLRNTPMFQPNPFLAFLNAAADRQISVSPEQMLDLVTAGLENPSATPSIEAMILNNYGRYQFQVMSDPREAVALTLAASELDPANPFFTLNLAKLAAITGDPEKARAYIQQARTLDVTGLYEMDLSRLEADLDGAQ